MKAINGVLERNPAAFDAKFKETEVRESVKRSMRTSTFLYEPPRVLKIVRATFR